MHWGFLIIVFVFNKKSVFLNLDLKFQNEVSITDSPRINVHAFIFEDTLYSVLKEVHTLIFEHKECFEKITCTYT